MADSDLTADLVGVEGLLSPYEGENGAHKTFRQDFKYLNALYYLIVSAKDVLRQHLKGAVKDAEVCAALRGADGKGHRTV